MQSAQVSRADQVAARATGIGFGLIAFMLTWIVANRVAGLFMPIPAAPITAMSLAVVTGICVSVRQGRRLTESLRVES